MWCWAGVGLSGPGVTGNSSEQLTARPSFTARRARSLRVVDVAQRAALVLGAPAPQFFTDSKMRSRSARLSDPRWPSSGSASPRPGWHSRQGVRELALLNPRSSSSARSSPAARACRSDGPLELRELRRLAQRTSSRVGWAHVDRELDERERVGRSQRAGVGHRNQRRAGRALPPRGRAVERIARARVGARARGQERDVRAQTAAEQRRRPRCASAVSTSPIRISNPRLLSNLTYRQKAQPPSACHPRRKENARKVRADRTQSCCG